MTTLNAESALVALRELALSSCMWPWLPMARNVDDDDEETVSFATDMAVQYTDDIANAGRADEAMRIALEASADLGAQRIPAVILATLLKRFPTGFDEMIPFIVRSPEAVDACLDAGIPFSQIQNAAERIPREKMVRYQFEHQKFLEGYEGNIPHLPPPLHRRNGLSRIFRHQLLTAPAVEWLSLTSDEIRARGGIPMLELLYLIRFRKITAKHALALIKLARRDNSLPFDFIAAADEGLGLNAKGENGQLVRALNIEMLESLNGYPRLSGKTIFCVDLSGSMASRLREAVATAVMLKEICDKAVIYATGGDDMRRTHCTYKASDDLRGFPLYQHILTLPVGGGGVFMEQVVNFLKRKEKSCDRLMMITDENDCSSDKASSLKVVPFGTTNYVFNVSFSQGHLAKTAWMELRGWSPQAVRYVEVLEDEEERRKMKG